MSSGFVTESEIEEKRKLRQEEWDKVRQPHEPEVAPEEVIDHRSLFDRLEEQKNKKQVEYEEAHKLKNMIKGLDDDEVEFLDFVDRKKMEAEQLKELEEKQELLEFRKNVEKLKESSLEERIQAEIRVPKLSAVSNGSACTKSQHKLLKGVVVKRKSVESNSHRTAKLSDIEKDSGTEIEKLSPSSEVSPGKKRKRNDSDGATVTGLTCVGILPGLGNYLASSDSDSDSSISDTPDHLRPKFDLLGRRLHYQTVGSTTKSQNH